jgi:cysteine desulfurase
MPVDRIYLDYNASTPIAPEVAKVIKELLDHHYGNPSSTHWAGAPAKKAVELARKQIAGLLGCAADEIIFTSGGSESNNHGLKGVYHALKSKGHHIVTTQIEHPAVMNPCRYLESLGAKVTYVGVDAYGRVSPEDIEAAVTDQTILISVMHANNEVGTLQPLAEISRIAKARGVLLHTDAAQSVGKVPTLVDELGVDLLTIAGHKLYAPKGVGALYVRRGTPIEPFVHGAGHEDGRRAGTENVIFAAALGKACELAKAALQNSSVRELRDYFWEGLRSRFTKEELVLNGHPDYRLPNTLNVSFAGRIGSDILHAVPTIAASTGSACHSGLIKLSPVLQAMNVREHVGMGAVRFSLGLYSTLSEIDEALRLLEHSVRQQERHLA